MSNDNLKFRHIKNKKKEKAYANIWEKRDGLTAISYRGVFAANLFCFVFLMTEFVLNDLLTWQLTLYYEILIKCQKFARANKKFILLVMFVAFTFKWVMYIKKKYIFQCTA